MSGSNKHDTITQAAAQLVLRELSDIETRDVFGGQWVRVGPVEPIPPKPKVEN